MRMTLAILATVGIASHTAADQFDVPDQFPTIQEAIEAAETGDVILVAPGTYYESIDFSGKGVTVRSLEGPEQTVIDASETGGSVALFWSFEGPDSILDGFTLTGGSGTDSAGMLRGGGVFAQSSSPVIRNCHIVGNQAEAGGGLAAWTASPWLFDCLIKGNSATASGSGGGGGVHLYSSFPRLVNVEIRSNTGVGSAAAGAIAMHELSDAEVVNCLIVDNTGRHTGGIYNINSILEMCNTTFSGNEATNSSNGEALKVIGPSAVGLALNCIFWENGDVGEADEIENALGVTTVLNSCVQGGWDGEGNVDVDPQFVDVESGDFHLRAESPLVNLGNNEFLPPDITQDLSNNPRFADPDDPEIVIADVDLGAYEVQPQGPPPCEGDIDGDRAIALSDLLVVIGEWGTCESSTACAGDIDGDGFVGLSDLLIVIGNWGVCEG